MIVKNESHIILQGLKCVLPLIDTYVIVDTGSKDNTKDLIKNFFDSKGIFGFIYDSEWKDFGSNRSEALKLCEGKMDYAIVLDADDLINFPENGKEQLTDILLREKPNAAMMLIHLKDIRYYRTQIFKIGDQWRYVGVLHEYPTNDKDNNIIPKLPENFFMTGRCLGSRSISGRDKMKRDIQVLLNALEKEPKNERYVFYLAQSFRDDGNMLKAIEYYKKRAEMGGWNEEVYFSLYQVAMCYINLREKSEAEYWAQKATLVRSGRAEALYLLAKAFRESGDFYKAYHYIEKGRKLKYPHNDVLFIEKFPYEGGFEYEASIVEYYIFPDKRKGLKTCFRYLSKADVNKQNVVSNMRFYIEKIKGVEKGDTTFTTPLLSLQVQSLPKFFSLFEQSVFAIEIKNELYCLLKFTESYHLFAVVDNFKVVRWSLPFYFKNNDKENCTGIRIGVNNCIECALNSGVIEVNLDDQIEWLHPENF